MRDTENVTIEGCMVSGFDLGTLDDGTFKRGPYGRTGRIKCGTGSPTPTSTHADRKGL